MNDIQIFNSPEFGEVRTVIINGEPWFVGRDVAKSLGYAKPEGAIRNNVDKDDTLSEGVMDSMGRMQDTLVVNESGLYSLIFGSKLESAKKFKKWVTSEVLPQLRKTGSYGTPQVPVTTAEQIKLLAQGHTELKEEIDAVKSDVDELKKELPLFPYEADLIMNAARKKGVSVLGGKQSKAYRNRSIVHKVYRNLYLSLNIQFDVRTYKAIKRRYLEQAIESVEKWEPPIVLRDEILMENAQIKYDTK